MLQEIHEFRNLFTFLLMFSSSKNLQSSIYISMSAKQHPHFCLNLTLLASLPCSILSGIREHTSKVPFFMVMVFKLVLPCTTFGLLSLARCPQFLRLPLLICFSVKISITSF